MESIFTKAQLIEMVQERINWLDEAGVKMPMPTFTDRTIAKEASVYFNVKYNKNTKRFKKSEIVQTIRFMDNVRLSA